MKAREGRPHATYRRSRSKAQPPPLDRDERIHRRKASERAGALARRIDDVSCKCLVVVNHDFYEADLTPRAIAAIARIEFMRTASHLPFGL